MKPPASLVERLDDQGALSNIGEISRGDVLRAGIHPRDHASVLRVERGKAQLTCRAGPPHVGEVAESPAVGEKAWPKVVVFRWSDGRDPDRVSAPIRHAEEPACIPCRIEDRTVGTPSAWPGERRRAQIHRRPTS